MSFYPHSDFPHMDIQNAESPHSDFPYVDIQNAKSPHSDFPNVDNLILKR